MYINHPEVSFWHPRSVAPFRAPGLRPAVTICYTRFCCRTHFGTPRIILLIPRFRAPTLWTHRTHFGHAGMMFEYLLFIVTINTIPYGFSCIYNYNQVSLQRPYHGTKHFAYFQYKSVRYSYLDWHISFPTYTPSYIVYINISLSHLLFVLLFLRFKDHF